MITGTMPVRNPTSLAVIWMLPVSMDLKFSRLSSALEMCSTACATLCSITVASGVRVTPFLERTNSLTLSSDSSAWI